MTGRVSKWVHRSGIIALSPAWRSALLVFLVTRLVLGVWMWGVRQVYDQPISPDPILRPYLDIPAETNPWLEPWQRWDTLHYQAIAERGYFAYDSAVFTPPLYPLLLRGLSELTGMSTLLAAILIANLAFLFSLAALFELAERETGDQRLAGRTLVYLASFPTSFFFLAGYTESLYLLAAILAIRAARQQKWLPAGLWGAAAALTRLTGAFIVIPLAFAAWQAARQRRCWQPWMAPVLTCLGAAIFPLYIWLWLDLPPWQPWIVQTARFHGGLAFPGYSLFLSLENMISGEARLADWFDAGFLVLFLAALPAVFRRLPAIYGVYTATFLLLYLTRLSHLQPLLSTARYVLALFPAFIIFAEWGKKPWVNRAFLYASWLGLLLLSGQFAIWGWVG